MCVGKSDDWKEDTSTEITARVNIWN